MAATNTLVWLGTFRVYGSSIPGFGWSLVDFSPCCSCCKWPLVVSMLGGKCLVTNFLSRPGNVAKKPWLMPFRSEFGVGFPNERWKYGTIYVLVVFFLTIPLAWCMTGLTDGNKSTWISYRQFCRFPVPVKMHWYPLLYILTSVSEKFSVHPESKTI